MADETFGSFAPSVQFETPFVADDPFSPAKSVELAQLENAMTAAGYVSDLDRAIPAVLAGTFATFGESLGLLDDGDVQRFLDKHSPPVGGFFREHETGVRATGDILGAFMPIGLGVKVARSQKLAQRVLQDAFGERVGLTMSRGFSTGKTTQQLFEETYNAGKLFAIKQGRSLTLSPEFQTARRAAMVRRGADIFIEGVAADIAVAGLMNESDFLFPANATLLEHLAFFGGFNIAFGAGAAAIANRTFKTELIKRLGPLAEQAQNPAGLPLTDIAANVVNMRGPAVTVWARHLDDLAEEMKGAQLAGDATLESNIRSAQTAIRKRMAEIFRRLSEDDPIGGVTERFSMKGDSPEIRTAQAAVMKDPDAFTTARSFEEFTPTKGNEIEANLIQQTIKLQDEIRKTRKKAKTIAAELRGQRTPENRKRLEDVKNRLRSLHQDWEEAKNAIPLVVEITGDTQSAIRRMGIFQDGARTIDKLVDGTRRTTVGATGREFQVRPDGTLRVPSTVVPLDAKAALADVDLRGFAINDILRETKSKTEKELIEKVSSLESITLEATPAVTKLRERFPDRVMVLYANKNRPGLYSEKQTVVHSVPAVVTRDDIFGYTRDGKIIARPTDFTELQNNVFAALSPVEQTAMYDLAQAQFERVKAAGPETFGGMSVARGDNFVKLDLVGKLVDEFGQDIAPKINGFTSSDELAFWALEGKFLAYQQMRKQAMKDIAAGKDTPFDNINNVARVLNLPGDNHPIIRLFESAMIDKADLPLTSIARNFDQLVEGARLTLDEIPDAAPRVVKFVGDMLDMPRERKPFVAIVNTGQELLGSSTADLRQAVLGTRMLLVERLKRYSTDVPGEEGRGFIVGGVVNELLSHPEALAAAKQGLTKLVDGTQLSGELTKNFVTQNFRMRELPALRELDILADLSQKAGEKRVEALLKTENTVAGISHQEVFNKLLSPQGGGNRGDMVSFQLAVNALGQGWDVAPEIVVRVGDDGIEHFLFQLKSNSKRNRKLFRERYGQSMPDDAAVFMPSEANINVPVAMTKVAYEAVDSMNTLSQQLLSELNTLRFARGMTPLTRKVWHMPPKDLSGKHITYLIDRAGNVHTAVSASTSTVSLQLAQKEIAAARKQGRDLFAVDQAEMFSYFDAWGKTFVEMTDFTKPTRQTGPAKGTSFGSVVELGPDTIRAQIQSVLRGFEDVAREARATVFDPELNFMRFQKAASGVAANKETVFDFAMNRILGTQNMRAESFIGTAYGSIENTYNLLMQRVYDRIAGTQSRFIARSGTDKQYQDYVNKTTPEFNPFHDFNDFVEKTARVRLPGELRAHAGKLNEITTALGIRIFDVGMGVINMASLATTLPPVVKALNRRLDESIQQHLSRIAAWGSTTPDGQGFFSPVKAVISGTHFMMSPEGRRIADLARGKGYFDQFAAEQIALWERTGQGFVSGLLRTYSDKASYVTDKTERLAREISFMTFFNVGKKGLGLEDNAAMAFAHAQANNTIANFRPNNRPIIFQGAAGMPLGLFTTFMWNFLHRLYGAVEAKDMGTLINQVGLQTFLFGAEAVPGVDKFINVFTANYDGSENIVDRMTRAYGQDFTDVFLHGTVSNIPKLFGGEGISVGPRAAIGLPYESGISAQSIAGVRLVGRLWNTSHKLVDSIRQERGLDIPRMGEIVAAANINKGLTNAIELAQGYSLDTAQNVVETNTRDAIGVASRALGFKPLVTDELRQENRRNRVTDRVRGALKERLADQLKSKLRRGALSDDDVEQALEDYVRAGGNGENFRRFFMSQVTRGLTNKLDLELAKALKNSNDQNRIARLLFLDNSGQLPSGLTIDINAE